jgi:HupF/HypC family
MTAATPGPPAAVDVSDLARLAPDLAATSLTLARRFAGGATMWCVSPRWPAHARHVAVEFVHPVIVGKRALPAAQVEAADLVPTLRLLARPGDIVAVIATADDPGAIALLRRVDAWGLTSVWIGAGPRPEPGAAHHVCWVDGADPAVAGRSGAFVLIYHLLWELTHVVFEHPGLLAADAGGGAVSGESAGDVCVTCSDEGRTAEVTTVVDPATARVLAGGHEETVDTTLVDDLGPGDLVLVHAGTAIAVLGEEDR